MNNKKVCWISAGVSSFIAGYLARDTIDEFIYIDIDDQHPDSMRFIKDCERILGMSINILKSNEYANVEEAILSAGFIRNVQTGFSPCTNWLKKRVRKNWENEHEDYHLTYVWGMDVEERDRAERIVEGMPEYDHEFPLIERQLTKQDAHGICDQLGIRRPLMYDLGYNNNNCIGCLKGGKGYWNKIRVDFPEVFERRAKLERTIGHTILKESDGTPLYLDELDPNRGSMSDEIDTECGIYCQLQLWK